MAWPPCGGSVKLNGSITPGDADAFCKGSNIVHVHNHTINFLQISLLCDSQMSSFISLLSLFYCRFIYHRLHMKLLETEPKTLGREGSA
jgi:hypothetical protein